LFKVCDPNHCAFQQSRQCVTCHDLFEHLWSLPTSPLMPPTLSFAYTALCLHRRSTHLAPSAAECSRRCFRCCCLGFAAVCCACLCPHSFRVGPFLGTPCCVPCAESCTRQCVNTVYVCMCVCRVQSHVHDNVSILCVCVCVCAVACVSLHVLFIVCVVMAFKESAAKCSPFSFFGQSLLCVCP
jgi:hypothetical protein